MEAIIWHSFLDKYFDENTMSMHIKENRPWLFKKWKPGERNAKVDDSLIMNRKELLHLVDQIFKEVEERDDGFLEIDKSLSKVMQLGPYRIVIVHPPLSDGLEMTIVKPIKKLTIDDYELDEDTMDLLRNKSKGILVSGSPGSGKTTFVQALVDLYHADSHTIKTLESPRDLLVSEDVVQYSFTYGSHDELRDILLLSRPDYTIYDEVRNKPDFELYKDLRLTGIWLVWVIHATRPVDSIQRFLGTIEMWIIPQVIDTVIYIDGWKVEEILQLKLTVKAPAGMDVEDLARPVIQVSSFFTSQVEYEIYTFGEQIVVMPMNEVKNKQWAKWWWALWEYAKNAVYQKLSQLLPCDFLLSIKSSERISLYIPESYRARVIGKAWAKIQEIEKWLWLKIDLHSFEDLKLLDVQVKTQLEGKSQSMQIKFPAEYKNKTVCFLVGDNLMYLNTNNQAHVNIKKKSDVKLLSNKWFVLVDWENM